MGTERAARISMNMSPASVSLTCLSDGGGGGGGGGAGVISGGISG